MAFLGKIALGALKGAVNGLGAYNVAHNTLVAGVPGISNPGREGATQIRHREFIGDVKSSSSFTIQHKLALNAGQEGTFPWASNIAKNFAQYQLNGVMFEFVSTSGDATGGNTALGEVLMATQYDSVLPDFTNKPQMLNQQFSSISKPSINCVHAIECAPSQTTIPLLYVRAGEQPPNTDKRFFDHGTFYLATSGNQSDGSALGELWVTYDILLFKPQLNQGPKGDFVDTDMVVWSATVHGSEDPFHYENDQKKFEVNTLGMYQEENGNFALPSTASGGHYMFLWTWWNDDPYHDSGSVGWLGRGEVGSSMTTQNPAINAPSNQPQAVDSYLGTDTFFAGVAGAQDGTGSHPGGMETGGDTLRPTSAWSSTQIVFFPQGDSDVLGEIGFVATKAANGSSHTWTGCRLFVMPVNGIWAEGPKPPSST